MDELDDWGVQGGFGLTYQLTGQATIGLIYRSESSTYLRGDLKVKNFSGGLPPVNALASSLDSAKISWDYPQMVSLGLKYKLTDQLSIINYQLSIINYQLSIINYQLWLMLTGKTGQHSVITMSQ